MIFGRLIMRLFLVPLGAGVAVVTAVLFVIAVYWGRFSAMIEADGSSDSFIGLAVVGSFTLGLLASVILLPAILGVVIAEAFAIRSWMFHIVNGAASAWIGANSFTGTRAEFYADPVVVAMGIVAGFAYWLVAGWSAGFWKPVFDPPIGARALPVPKS
jgi:hypothetical protein